MDREKIIKDLEFCVNGHFKVELSLATKILALLKEQDEIIQRVLREKTNELNYKTTTIQIEIQNKEIRKVLEQKK